MKRYVAPPDFPATIAVAWTVEEFRVIRPGQQDLGRPPVFEAYREPKAVIWCNSGGGEDLVKAQKWADSEGYRVITLPVTEPDPLGAARAIVSGETSYRR